MVRSLLLTVLLIACSYGSKIPRVNAIIWDGTDSAKVADSALYVTMVDSPVVIVADTPAVKLMGEFASDSFDYVEIDRATNATVQTQYEHHKIHAGSHYFHEGYETISADDTLDFGVQTPDNTKWTHIVWIVESTLGILFQVREAATITWDGTDQTSYNNDRNSANTSNWVNFELDPTPTGLGTLLAESQIGSATNPVKGLPGGGGREREIILKQNTVYLFRIISLNNSNVVSYLAEWYEHTNKH